MAALTSTKKVLQLRTSMADEVEFSREPDEPGDIPAIVWLPRTDWLDMGEPQAVTVTIEPGDLLN